jgi:predicted dehydrogenase
VTRWTTDLKRALDNQEDTIYFDSGATGQCEQNVMQAIAAGKHTYCEKPLATTLFEIASIAALVVLCGLGPERKNWDLWASPWCRG